MVIESPHVWEATTSLLGSFPFRQASTWLRLRGARIGDAGRLPSPKQDGSAVRFIVSDTGVISDIKIDSAIYDLPGFEELELYKKSGDAISEPHSSNDRVGHVICTAPMLYRQERRPRRLYP